MRSMGHTWLCSSYFLVVVLKLYKVYDYYGEILLIKIYSIVLSSGSLDWEFNYQHPSNDTFTLVPL